MLSKENHPTASTQMPQAHGAAAHGATTLGWRESWSQVHNATEELVLVMVAVTHCVLKGGQYMYSV